MYIKKVAFKNCQSLKDVEYELSSGLNVIIAPDNDGNSTGKSVFFKCLRTAVGAEFFDASEIVHLISYGETAAAVLFTLSDESAGGFLVANRSVIYLYREAESSELERLNSPHPEFLRKLSIVMDHQTKFVLNILDADQELLFVNSREDTNFSTLKLVSDNEALESVIPSIEEEISEVRTLLARSQRTNAELYSRLGRMENTDLSKLKRQVEYGEAFLPISRQLLQIIYYLSDLKVREYPNYIYAELSLSLYRGLTTLHKLVSEIKMVTLVDWDKMFKSLEVHLCLERIHKYLGMYKDNLSLLRDKNDFLGNICERIHALDLVVECPVKGKVYFFEEGCIEAGD